MCAKANAFVAPVLLRCAGMTARTGWPPDRPPTGRASPARAARQQRLSFITGAPQPRQERRESHRDRVRIGHDLRLLCCFTAVSSKRAEELAFTGIAIVHIY